jgi:Fur family ferric uptake transcriptional regulator
MAGAEHPGAAGVEPGGPGPDEYVRSLLREYGLRCTAPRLAVVALFVDVESPEGHLTAAQIHARLVDQRRGVDLATVYRTVSTLVELGVLHALAVEENVTTYGLAAEPHHHAICSRCAAIIEVPAGRLSTALAQASLGSDFLLSETAGLTLHGLCPDCGPTRTD